MMSNLWYGSPRPSEVAIRLLYYRGVNLSRDFSRAARAARLRA